MIGYKTRHLSRPNYTSLVENKNSEYREKLEQIVASGLNIMAHKLPLCRERCGQVEDESIAIKDTLDPIIADKLARRNKALISVFQNNVDCSITCNFLYAIEHASKTSPFSIRQYVDGKKRVVKTCDICEAPFKKTEFSVETTHDICLSCKSKYPMQRLQLMAESMKIAKKYKEKQNA